MAGAAVLPLRVRFRKAGCNRLVLNIEDRLEDALRVIPIDDLERIAFETFARDSSVLVEVLGQQAFEVAHEVRQHPPAVVPEIGGEQVQVVGHELVLVQQDLSFVVGRGRSNAGFADLDDLIRRHQTK